MNLSDLDSKVKELSALRESLKEKLEEKEKTKDLAHQRSIEAERLKKLSLLAEKPFDVPEVTLDKEIEAEATRLESEITKLEGQIAEGISELKFPFKSPDPEITNGNAIFHFREGSYENAIDYMKLALNMKQQLIIDNVVFDIDKIEVRGKSDADVATDCLMNAAQSIRTLGSIMLGKVSEEMKTTIDFLNSSTHKKLWEFLGLRGTITLQNAYENFGYTTESEKKRARTFFSQLESRSKPPLATGDGKGSFNLTIYGRFVWTSYRKQYAVPEDKAEEHISETPVKEPQPQETAKKPSQTALQNFMEKVLLDEGE